MRRGGTTTTIAFTAEVRIRGVNPYVLVSAERATALRPGWRRPLPVVVRVDGRPEDGWRVNMMPVGDGDFYLYLAGTVRAASGASVGDRVSVEIRFDASYSNGPQHAMLPSLRRALEGAPIAWENWKALPPSRKKELLRYLARLRSPEARERNVARALAVLSGKAGRFLGRDWREGR